MGAEARIDYLARGGAEPVGPEVLETADGGLSRLLMWPDGAYTVEHCVQAIDRAWHWLPVCELGARTPDEARAEFARWVGGA